MARPIRIQHAGALYHLMARGNNKQPVYFTDRDRRHWVQLLGAVCIRHDWQVLAWCQMGNHYHLVVRTLRPTLSMGMRQLNGCYTQWVNHAHDRVGHVFQGRFKSLLVESDSYLLELSRYVLLNPVRGGLVQDPAAWRWSSCRATLGQAPVPDWLECNEVLSYFGSVESPLARRRFRDYLMAGINASPPWLQVIGQAYLGSEDFAQQASRLANRDALEIPRAQREPLHMPPLKLPATDQAVERQKAILEAWESGRYRLAEIALAAGCHYSTISRLVKRMGLVKSAVTPTGSGLSACYRARGKTSYLDAVGSKSANGMMEPAGQAHAAKSLGPVAEAAQARGSDRQP